MWRAESSDSSLPEPILTEGSQSWQRFAVLGSIRRRFARDDVVQVTHRKTFHFDPPPPRFFEGLDAVGGEDEVKVERTVLELHEILSPFDLGALRLAERESQLTQRKNDGVAVGVGLLGKQIGILG